MKILIAILMISVTVYGEGTTSTSEGPRFDSNGHLSAYVYADGKSETYAYDSQWRIMRFTDRNGNVTIFKYGADGSMTVVKPDGTQ